MFYLSEERLHSLWQGVIGDEEDVVTFTLHGQGLRYFIVAHWTHKVVKLEQHVGELGDSSVAMGCFVLYLW